MITIIIWAIIYLASIVFVVVNALSKKKNAPTFAVNSFTYLVNVFAPWAAIIYLEKLELNQSRPIDLVITIHVVLILLSCLTLVGWGFVYGMNAMKHGGLKVFNIIFIAIAPIIGFITIFAAIWDPNWFINKVAYEKDILIKWIWPGTIDAPITYFRTALAFGNILAMFVKNKSLDNESTVTRTQRSQVNA